MSLDNGPTPTMLRLYEDQKAEILAFCERWGYGATISTAAQAWAKIPPMDRKGMAQWLRRYADQLSGWKIGRLERVREHLKLQAQIWAQEARTQRSIVLGILRELGLPMRDWEAEPNVRGKVGEIRRDLATTLALLRECTPALFSWNDADLYMRVHAHLERLDPQPASTEIPF